MRIMDRGLGIEDTAGSCDDNVCNHGDGNDDSNRDEDGENNDYQDT